MKLFNTTVTSGKNTYNYFSTTGKVGGKSVRRLQRRGKPVYEVAKFPKGDKLEVTVDKTDYVAKAIKALLS